MYASMRPSSDENHYEHTGLQLDVKGLSEMNRVCRVVAGARALHINAVSSYVEVENLNGGFSDEKRVRIHSREPCL